MTKRERKRLGRCRWTVCHMGLRDLRVHKTKRAAMRDARGRIAANPVRSIMVDRFSLDDWKAWEWAGRWARVEMLRHDREHMRCELDGLARLRAVKRAPFIRLAS